MNWLDDMLLEIVKEYSEKDDHVQVFYWHGLRRHISRLIEDGMQLPIEKRCVEEIPKTEILEQFEAINIPELKNLKLRMKQKIVFNMLWINKNNVVSNDSLLRSGWPKDPEGSLNNLGVVISKLRKKLTNVDLDLEIKVRTGEGYMLIHTE